MAYGSKNRVTFSARLLFALGLLASGAARSDTPAACPGGKMALVIGNSDYTSLKPVSGKVDACAIATSLRRIGFCVTELENATFAEMSGAIHSFGLSVRGASEVVFFYSGHGFQLDGESYLVPKDLQSVTRKSPETSVVPVTDAVDALGAADTATSTARKVVILDACRNDTGFSVDGKPISGLDGWKPGLAKPPEELPDQTVVAYAASPNQSASSGKVGDFSPYSKALVSVIADPGLEMRELLATIHEKVAAQGSQTPWETELENLPDPTYLSEPAQIQAVIQEADDDLEVLLNRKKVLSWSTDATRTQTLSLKPHENHLFLKVTNNKTFRNLQAWERTEGWFYTLQLSQNGEPLGTLKGCEDNPFKDGPHHKGKQFKAAKVDIEVTPATPPPTAQECSAPQPAAPVKVKPPSIRLVNKDENLWQSGDPDLTQGQMRLQEQQLAGGIYLAVYGNKRYGADVERCTKNGIISGFEPILHLILEVTSGAPRPADGLVADLQKCVGHPVWIATEDRSHDPPEGLNRCPPSGGTSPR